MIRWIVSEKLRFFLLGDLLHVRFDTCPESRAVSSCAKAGKPQRANALPISHKSQHWMLGLICTGT